MRVVCRTTRKTPYNTKSHPAAVAPVATRVTCHLDGERVENQSRKELRCKYGLIQAVINYDENKALNFFGWGCAIVRGWKVLACETAIGNEVDFGGCLLHGVCKVVDYVMFSREWQHRSRHRKSIKTTEFPVSCDPYIKTKIVSI